MRRTSLPFALFPLVVALSNGAAQTAESGAIEFNRDIRPILSDHCFTCHGPDATHRQAGLRFDTADGPGWVIAPGHPEQSEIVRRITATDGDQMPPKTSGKKPISASEAELIRRWIAQGAQYQPFWSFIPPKMPALPEVANKSWVRNPIDRFILARLEREGLRPSPEADKLLLIRRVSLDLTGLPPAPAEVEAFVADTSPDAYEKVVDRLLASPRYGERMAFRWMEAARYGDSNGYQTDGPRDMWRWRDWVISAFNGNMPWNQFTVEQLAGDLLPNATLDQRIASGFNRNHRTTGEGGIIDEEYRVEYVADRTQTTSTVFMGLTLGCARCHDHKYDPLAQKDFYRFFAYFNQIPGERGFTWNYGPEEPYVKAPLPDQQERLEAMDAGIDDARKVFESLRPKIEAAQVRWERDTAHLADWTPTDGLIFRSDWAPSALPLDTGPAGKARHYDGKEFLEANGDSADFSYLDPFTFSAWIKPESPDGAILTRLDDFIESQGHGLYLIGGKLRLHLTQRFTDLGLRVETSDPLKLNEWQHVLATYDGKRLARGVKLYVNGESRPVKILFDQNTEPFHKKNTPIRVGAGGGLRFKGSIGDARIYNRALSPEEAAALSVAEPIGRTPAVGRTKAQQAKLDLAFLETAAPKDVREARAELAALQTERDKFYDSIPTVMVMADGANRDTFLLKRGAYDALGEKVTAGVPQVLPQLPPDLPDNRLGLAKWLVDRSNPLMARVTVNRFWQSYFGFGIVKTVDDFGSQGEWPVHPELLDWLAVEFMDSGWNVKAMQKLIVMSAAYRQSSAVTPGLLERDPDNRLLARGPRLRLGPEAIRDQALAVSGLLVDKQGGPSVKPYQPAGLWQELSGSNGYVQEKGDGLYRRSLYTYWKRTVPHPFMMNFDSPNREQCAVFENRTNSPLQALDLMNEVTFVEAARKLAERMMTEGGASPEARLDYGYSLVLARVPSGQRKKAMLRLLGELETNYKANPKAASDYIHQGESPVRARIDAVQLAAWTGVASLILNLDEAITKE
jgi:mono/diheme cytochrome c family protein